MAGNQQAISAMDRQSIAVIVQDPKVTQARNFDQFGTNFKGSPEPIYGSVFLPRKFKIAVTVPGDNSVDLFTNDVGIVVLTSPTGELEGYNLVVGGGMGRSHRYYKPTTICSVYSVRSSVLFIVYGLRLLARVSYRSRQNVPRTSASMASSKHSDNLVKACRRGKLDCHAIERHCASMPEGRNAVQEQQHLPSSGRAIGLCGQGRHLPCRQGNCGHTERLRKERRQEAVSPQVLGGRLGH